MNFRFGGETDPNLIDEWMEGIKSILPDNADVTLTRPDVILNVEDLTEAHVGYSITTAGGWEPIEAVYYTDGEPFSRTVLVAGRALRIAPFSAVTLRDF